MPEALTGRLRTLVADDEKAMLYVYREILGDEVRPPDRQAGPSDGGHQGASPPESCCWPYDLTLCRQAEEAVQAVDVANKEGRPFAVAFLDVHMPPGKDGVWAAEQIRGLDSNIDNFLIRIVLCFRSIG